MSAATSIITVSTLWSCRVRAVIKEDPQSPGDIKEDPQSPGDTVDPQSPGDTVCREPRRGRQRVVYESRGSLVEVRLATGSSATSSSSTKAAGADNTPEYFLVEFEGLITTHLTRRRIRGV